MTRLALKRQTDARSRNAAAFFATVLVAAFSFDDAFANNWSIEGTLLTPDTVMEGTLIIEGDKISRIAPPGGSPTLKVDDVIVPGFVDLHNHLT